jgi:ribosomal protein S14
VSADRDRYVEVCRAMRLSVERAIETTEGRELPRYSRVLQAGLAFTAGWSRLGTEVWLPQIAELAGVDEKRTADLLALADRRGVLAWRPSRRRGAPSWIGLPGAAQLQLELVTDLNAALPVRGRRERKKGECYVCDRHGTVYAHGGILFCRRCLAEQGVAA